VSPKLTRRVRTDGKTIVLTGILPSSEIAGKPIWQSAGLVGDELRLTCDPDAAANRSHGLEDPRLKRKAVETLSAGECFVGSEVASRMGWKEGAEVAIEGASFMVSKVLPACGTVDDDRVFVHLHRAQEMFGAKGRLSVIEIMGCCNAISDGLLGKIRNVLPDTRVTSIHQIVSTQVETNRLMDKVSLGFLVIVFLVGGLSIGNFMWANVNQRRREIGTLVMIGTPRSGLYRLFLSKAVGLGLVGGLLGYAVGTAGAVVAGPWFANLDVRALPIFLLWSVLLSVGVALLGSLLPAWLAARMEPFSNMQEV
jgi:putative ABC transport system permease protein